MASTTKFTPAPHHTKRSTVVAPRAKANAGPNGVALAPPVYGIGVVDQDLASGGLGKMAARPLHSSRGEESPLPDEGQNFIEPRFGANLSQGRVHVGSDVMQPAGSTHAVQAMKGTLLPLNGNPPPAHTATMMNTASARRGKLPKLSTINVRVPSPARESETAEADQESSLLAGSLQREPTLEPTTAPTTAAKTQQTDEAGAAALTKNSAPSAGEAMPSPLDTGDKPAVSEAEAAAQGEAQTKTAEKTAIAEQKVTAETKTAPVPVTTEGRTAETAGGAALAASARQEVALGTAGGGETQSIPTAAGGAPPMPSTDGGSGAETGGAEGAANELEARLEEASPEADLDTKTTEATSDILPESDLASAAPTTMSEEREPNAADTPVPDMAMDTSSPEADTGSEERAPEATGDGPAGGPSITPVEPPAPAPEPELTASEDVDELAAVPGSSELSTAERAVAMSALAEKAGDGGGEPSGGGGGGSAISDKPPVRMPDVTNQEPEAALASASKLSPAQLQATLGDVSASVNRSVGEKQADLKANPPQMARPTGAPQTKEQAGAGAEPGESQGKGKVERAPEGQAKPTPAPEPLPAPPASPAEAVREPQVAGTPKGEMSEADVSHMQSAIAQLPTTDPGLYHTSGPPPQVELTGNADPARAQEQHAKLNMSVGETHAQGRREVAVNMGEDQVFPTVPKGETLRANVPETGGKAATGGPAADGMNGGGGTEQEAASIIAQEQKGGEIQAAIAKARGEMAVKRQDYTKAATAERARAYTEIEKAKTENATAQAVARQQVQQAVKQQRGEWSKAQEDEVRKADTEAKKAYDTGLTEVQERQIQADKEAARHIQQGNTEAERARRQAEEEAAAQKRKAKGEGESGGFFSWLAGKAKAFFNGIKNAIKAAFDAARKVVKAAIETAKKLAVAAIEMARKAIVAVIRKVGDALIAIGDRMLAAFPELRKKFRAKIKNLVDKAEAAVNTLADKLKQGVQKLLDALGAALDAALGLLEKGLQAAVGLVGSVVQGAIKFADGVVKAVAGFAVLIKDVATSPLQWIKNFGAGIVDGIRNHLWKAFKSAVQEWFNAKLEQVLGLGAAVWNLLKSGGLAVTQIGQMAWEAIKAMIPRALVQILIEKLVAMLVPAAGAVMVIIEGLRAAWGTVSRIIQAFQLFMSFLKAVKSGGAGPQFAAALAAAAVAVIDFVANWLLLKLAKGLAKLGGKLKGIAQRIAGKKRSGKAKGKATGAKPKKATAKPKRKEPDKKTKDKEQQKNERVEKVRRELPPKINTLISKRPSKLRLRAHLAFWHVRYRLQSLKVLERSGTKAEIEARVNPLIKIADAYFFEVADLLRIVDLVAKDYIPKEAADDTSLPAVHDTTGKPREAMASMVGSRQHQFATDSFGRPVGVSSTIEEDRYGNEVLRIRPFERGRGPKYGTLAKQLEGMGPVLAEYYRQIFTGGTPEAMLSGKKGFADVGYGLWYVHEPGHKRFAGDRGPVPTWTNKRDLTYSMMLTELMASGEVDPKQAFSPQKLGAAREQRDVTSHPAAFGGAQSGAAYTTRKMERRDQDPSSSWTNQEIKKQKDTNKRERYYREVQLIKKWFSLHKEEILKVYPTKPTEAELEAFVRRKLVEYFVGKSH